MKQKILSAALSLVFLCTSVTILPTAGYSTQIDNHDSKKRTGDISITRERTSIIEKNPEDRNTTIKIIKNTKNRNKTSRGSDKTEYKKSPRDRSSHSDEEQDEQDNQDNENNSGPSELNKVEVDHPQKTAAFSWKYAGDDYNWEVEVPEDTISYSQEIYDTIDEFYTSSAEKQQEMLDNMDPDVKSIVLANSQNAEGDMRPYMVEDKNQEFVAKLSRSLKEKAEEKGLDYFQTAEFTLKFVQSAISYELGDSTKLPAQTIFDKKGDCDDKSILLSSLLLNEMGYDPALIYYSQESTGTDLGHVAVGVAFDNSDLPDDRSYTMHYAEHDGEKYYLAETTENTDLGEEIGLKTTAVYPFS